jgi:hypothetical protein
MSYVDALILPLTVESGAQDPYNWRAACERSPREGDQFEWRASRRVCPTLSRMRSEACFPLSYASVACSIIRSCNQFFGMSVYFDIEDQLWRFLVVASVDPGFWAEKGTDEGELVNVNARQLDGVVFLRRQGVKRPDKGVGDDGDESLEEISRRKITLLTFRLGGSTYGRTGDFGKRNERRGPQVLLILLKETAE